MRPYFMFDVLTYTSSFGDLDVKTLKKNGMTLFKLSDVVRVITRETQEIDGTQHSDQISLLSESLSALDDDERHEEVYQVNDETKRDYYITEPGIFRVVSRADSSGAKKFQRWVFHEVLPSIREFNRYPPPKPSKDSFTLQLADEQAKNSQLLSKYIRESEEKLQALDEKCEVNSKEIGDLNNRVSSVENLAKLKQGLFRLSEIIKIDDISEEELNILLGRCEKISSEKNIRYEPSIRKVRAEQKFEIEVIKLMLEIEDCEYLYIEN